MRYFISTWLVLFSFHNAWSQDDSLFKALEALAKNTSGIPFGENKANGKYYEVRGIKMYVETYGKGAPLLMIHGNGGSIKDFLHQVPYFMKKYKVIVADNRAHGNSIDKGDSLTYEMMADDYAALLDQMKLDSVYTIGWSDGGINALLLSLRHPHKIRKMAITGANLWPDTTAVYKEGIDLIQPGYLWYKTKKDKSEKENNAWKLMRLLVEQPNIRADDLQMIRVPTLVIGGDHDVIKPAHTMLIAEKIPRSYLWILPNSGHSTPLRYKDEFNKKIDEFFSQEYKEIKGAYRFF